MPQGETLSYPEPHDHTTPSPVRRHVTSGCVWRHLPPAFGTSSVTVHRRFASWTRVRLWRRLHGRRSTGSGPGMRWPGPRRAPLL
ncbi:transposase (plasmid) [Streptomyces sp. cg28]|uniref:transposase n=1 Tax=Streptomyces sp. cg28 TaxID=3403457 RepID=UPI003B211019